jgi:RNA polymerase sigma-70 factor (ECF subfamily)
MSLEERIAAALAGRELDRAATEAIRGYGPEILRYALTLCRSPDDARDVFAEFAARLWKALPTFRGATTVRAFAYRLVRHAASDFYSDGYHERRVSIPPSLASRLADSVHESSRASLERDAARLAGIRAQLAPEEETLLLLRLDRRLSWEEIAHALAGQGRAPDAAALRKRFERLKAKIGRKARKADLLVDRCPRPPRRGPAS